jgi:membrane-associated phospholipid phosphatase
VNGASIDGSWFTSLADFADHTAWLHGPMTAYTNLSIVLLGLLAVGGWWNARRHGDHAAMTAVAWTGIGTVLAVAVGLTSKQLFAEPRPCRALPNVHIVASCPAATDYAFPSDHTLIAIALAVGLWFVNRTIGALAIVIALLEAFSRVYLGEHYPHDAAAALVIGAALMVVGWMLLQRPIDRLLSRLEQTPLRPLLTAQPA